MGVLRWLGTALVVLALALLLSRERSRFSCTRQPSSCVLERRTLFSEEVRRIAPETITGVEVESYGGRRPTKTFVIVTAGVRVPFSSRRGYPWADNFARDILAFLGGDGPEVVVEYDSLGDIAPHAGMWGVIGLLMLGGAWMEGWAKRRPRVRIR